MNKNTFVSGCNDAYFPLLKELIVSIRRFPQSKDFDFHILDAGLTEEQREELRPHVQSIVNPDWPVEVPAYKIRGREYLKACVCRPFIPKLFPGYETYIWMDADVWAQNWRCFEMFLEGAARGKITLTAQADRAYPRVFRVKWLGQWPWKVRGFYFSNALKAFDFKTAKALLPRTVLLAGGFALRGDAPHWEHWQELVKKAMVKGKVFTAEQVSLGVMCYLDGYPYEILPAYAHWLCEFKPLWNPKKKLFVEPFLPHEEISLLHLSGFDEMRLDRSVTTDFQTTDGETVQMTYRSPHGDVL